ncbi:hypothetical protein XH89_12025 [Bradyrhizobium sp. CCBAU 53340]|nr:hypothetical protein XH89_12025 [Bradyrhizobium sp. CCBAU 53340]
MRSRPPRPSRRSRRRRTSASGSRRFSPPSLRAKRSNPDFLCGDSLDCFVASLPRNDEGSPPIRKYGGLAAPR